jgi:hypothetical protein
MGVDIFFDPMHTVIWLIGCLIFIVGFFWALIMSNADKRIYASLRGIPKFMFMQVLSLLKMRNANNISIATSHFHDKKLEDLN